jgi:hypothetical protein
VAIEVTVGDHKTVAPVEVEEGGDLRTAAEAGVEEDLRTVDGVGVTGEELLSTKTPSVQTRTIKGKSKWVNPKWYERHPVIFNFTLKSLIPTNRKHKESSCLMDQFDSPKRGEPARGGTRASSRSHQLEYSKTRRASPNRHRGPISRPS